MAFVSQSKGMEEMGGFTFNGVRSMLGAVVVFPLAFIRLKAQGRKATQIEETKKATDAAPVKEILLGGLSCGLIYTAASTIQQFGIAYTSVGKAGFITTLYIIIVPILGLFLKRKVPKIVWLGAFTAAVGMYLLCVTESFSLSPGDVLVFFSAVLFAVHILVIDHFVQKVDGTVLSCIQLFVCGILCTTMAFIWETPAFAQLQAGMYPLLYAGVLSCGVAYTLQIIGQKGTNPTVASLILSLESVVAALSGFFAYRLGMLKTDQTLSIKQIIGCAVVFASVLLVQLSGGNKENKK